ncbi:MAG: hypothetical protein GXP42_15820 [Chloroflexi bacterium]|nr:hypothetical protein [Chloroflexota bacterium]
MQSSIFSASPPKYLDIDLRAYAGCYIAIVEGVVLATGQSAEAARTRAKLARPQREPLILAIADQSASEDQNGKP